MRYALIALATGFVLASGVAAAGTTIPVTRDVRSATLVPVQYSDRNGYRGEDRSASINEREAQLRSRIERGINNGRITHYEARRLYRELASIEATERAYKADGRLSYREDADLNRRLDVLANNVRVQMRDDDRRYSYAR